MAQFLDREAFCRADKNLTDGDEDVVDDSTDVPEGDFKHNAETTEQKQAAVISKRTPKKKKQG